MNVFIAALLHGTTALQTQAAPIPAIPIRVLARSTARAVEPVGAIYGFRALSGSRVLVSDGRFRRLMVFDSSLASFTLSADSAGASGNKYPRYALYGLFPYVADSTLFVDPESHTYLVIDPSGRIARAMAPAKASDLLTMNAEFASAAGVDAHGQFIYRGANPPQPRLSAPGAPPLPVRTRDSVYIVRANFDTRVVDTLDLITIPPRLSARTTTMVNGRPTGTLLVNPVPDAADEWAVLSDGSLAIVRARDYHIDWVYADGSRASTPKMSFDWRRLTDEDKQAKTDSVKHIIDSLAVAGHPYGTLLTVFEGRERTDSIVPTILFVPLKEMLDYVPPIRGGSAKPDMDGHLWILPVTSSQAVGGLLYDVVNKKGEIFERVQLPAECDIAGFGRGGIVYLSRRDGAMGYYIERTTVLGQKH